PVFVGSADQNVICPGCSAELPAGTRFCTDCGSKIDQPVFVGSADQNVICPGCSAELPAGSRFCTNCGSKIEQVPVSGSMTQNMPVSDETVESVKETGKGLLKGMGGFLDKAAASINDATQSGPKYGTKVEQIPSYSRNPKVKPINGDAVESVKGTGRGLLKGMGGFLDNATSSIDNAASNETEVDNRGYVVCEKCGGYYELEEGESPDDFESCSCGGKLKYVKNLET
ncbi:MAG: zinc ribbon domain-containing protein, partial [Methanobacterium paludis]|nr:zinc ribbon domain-containing protein [Methanobacterium paludis]